MSPYWISANANQWARKTISLFATFHTLLEAKELD
jgi:hypothetical protein